MLKVLTAGEKCDHIFPHKKLFKQRKKEEALPRVSLLSNNKTKLFASSLGHISLWDGLLAVFVSSFEKRNLERGLLLSYETEYGVFSPMPLAAVPKGFSGEYSFVSTDSSVVYTGTFCGYGKRFSLSALFRLSPTASLVTVSASASGDIKRIKVLLRLFPVLEKEALPMRRQFSAYYDSKGRYYIRERRAKPGMGEPLFFGVSSSKVGEPSSVTEMPVRFLRELSSDEERITFSVALARDKDELLYLLQKNEDLYADCRAWESLCRLQRTFSTPNSKVGFSEQALLSCMAFGIHRFSWEKQKNFLGEPCLEAWGISLRNPLVCVPLISLDKEERSCLCEMLSFFRYLCVRGISIDLVFLCENDTIFRDAENYLETQGYADFVFYAGGIFLLERNMIGKKACAKILEAAVAKADIRGGIFYE